MPPDINKERPSQPRLKTYPRRKIGDRLRCFDPAWIENREWLEHSVHWDSCFCFPCRIFDLKNKQNPFTSGGFNNWKQALATEKVFEANKRSNTLEIPHSSWLEKRKMETSGREIKNWWEKLETDQVMWFKAVFHVTRFLSSNCLSSRGDKECTEVRQGLAGGLFLNTFNELLVHFQLELKEIALGLPKNTTYVSDDIQNEAISVLAALVHLQIANESENAKFFTIMVGGTTDKCGEEMQGLVVSYFSESEERIVDKALAIGPSGRSANEIFEFVKNSVEKYGLTFNGLVSQVYDGASVMSYIWGRFQAILSAYCQRVIIYIHCFAHKLNLVIKNVIQNIDD